MRYTKIGRFVIVSGELSSFSSTSNSSNIEVTGVPFSTESGCSHVGAVNASRVNQYSGYTTIAAARIEEGSNRIVFLFNGIGASNTRFPVRYGDLNSGALIQFTVSYMTA